MSNEATSWAIRQDPGGAGPKLLLMILANHAGKDGVCYPGREILTDECCCKRKATVTDNFARLERLGLVQRLQRRRANGSRTSDWTILAPAHADRGEMVDADDTRPENVASLARRGTESVPDSGTENVPRQVRKTYPVRYGKPTPLKRKGNVRETSEPPISPPIKSIFEHWRQTMGKNGARLTPERRSKIAARLKQGYTADQIKRAIDGCAGSKFHRDGGYNDLTLICRSGAKLESFEAMPVPDHSDWDGDALLARTRRIYPEAFANTTTQEDQP
jgi:Helix-turn-helix domain